MFWKKGKPRQISSSMPRADANQRQQLEEDMPRPVLPGTVPSDVTGEGKRYYETFVAPVIKFSRERIVNTVLVAVVLFQAIGISQLIPLHERIPFIAEFDENDGRLKQDERFKVVGVENVKQKQIDFFARRWARCLWTIDSQLRVNLDTCGRWVRGAAANELLDFYSIDRAVERLTKEPTLTREFVRKPVITYGQGKTLFMHFELVEKNNGVEIRRTKKIMQIDYALVPELADDDENPIGFVITHFTSAEQ